MHIRYLLALTLCSPLVLADDLDAPTHACSRCIIEPPVIFSSHKADKPADPKQIRITSDQSAAKAGDKATFEGNVVFSQGTRHIAADKAVLNQVNKHLNADGNLVFQDDEFTVTANSMMAEMNNNSAEISAAKYWLNGKQIHGSAEKLKITKNKNLYLTNTDFTTCPPGDSSWMIEARKIKIDTQEGWSELWDAKLKIGDVPVFYLPYMNIPISDKRKTGFLFPQINTNSINGLELIVPYYWNIAPEYDLTFTPHYMTNRGLFLKTNFRYLAFDNQRGQLDFEYLNHDNLVANSPNRYLYHWQHSGSINKNWRVLADFTDVSDDNYSNDLQSDVLGTSTNQLTRFGQISYLERNWDVNVKVEDIKVLSDSPPPFQVTPQVNFNYRKVNVLSKLDFRISGEATNFRTTNRTSDHSNKPASSAKRIHLEPSLSLPFNGPAGSITSEIKLLQTNYWQDTNNYYTGTQQLKSSVNRTIPQLKIHGKINFERQQNYFGVNYRQTIEPQLQYLYVGYQDQSDIGVYDTALLQNDYYGLFRDRRFSGLDRISDANQITYGLTSRLFNEHNQETFKFSLGQIYYFKNSRVSLNSADLSNSNSAGEKTSTSVIAAELNARIHQNWFMGGAMQYDTLNNENKKSEVTLDFRPETNKLLQLSYRYVNDSLDNNASTAVNVAQTGLRSAWPINDSWYFIGNWYYDLNEKRSAEIHTGFQYESCCWGARLSYQYRIKTGSPVVFDKGFYLSFVIKGLSGSGPLVFSGTGASDKDLFSYRKPLYLKN